MKSPREIKLEKILTQFIQPIKNIPFEIVIQALFNKNVKKFDPRVKTNKLLLKTIAKAMCEVCKNIQANPIKRNRPNEVGNDIEAFVISALQKYKIKASAPKTKSDKQKSTAYPDIKITKAGLPVYLEVKTYAKNSKNTSLRSFFLSPSQDPKVTESAFHIAVGFEMIQKNKTFYPVAFKIIDLYGLDCDMKAEFNSDNKRLYQKNRILAHGNSKSSKITLIHGQLNPRRL